MKKFLIFLLAASALAAWAGSRWQPMPLEEQLVRIRAADTFPVLAPAFAGEPVEVLATLVDYADDNVLLLEAQAAVLRYPRLAREILPLYGEEPLFREVLRTHGAAVLLPIDYFLGHEIRTVSLLDSVARMSSGDKAAKALTPRERGLYAVHFIHDEGHDFLGQFALDAHGNTTWIQTERALEALTSFFTSGIRTIETKVRTDQKIEAGDLGWAAVDVLAITGATALLRAGKVAGTASRATKSARVSGRTGAYASYLTKALRVGAGAAKYAKWPAIVATGIILVRHPSLISSLLGGAADVLGLPPVLLLGVGWTVIMLLLLYVASWVWRLVVRPVAWLVVETGKSRGQAGK